MAGSVRVKLGNINKILMDFALLVTFNAQLQ